MSLGCEEGPGSPVRLLGSIGPGGWSAEGPFRNIEEPKWGWGEGQPCPRRPPPPPTFRENSLSLPTPHPPTHTSQPPPGSGVAELDLKRAQSLLRTKDFSASFNKQMEAQLQARLGC